MEVDMSDYTIRGVLSIECEDGKQRPVTFLSKSLNETERNYEIHSKEMLVVVRGLKNWKHLLKGTKYKFEVWTNHKNLEYFMKAQKLNWKQTHWALYLFRFDFTLKHVLGTKMGKVDGLSKRPDWKVGVEKDNDNQVFIKDCWQCNLQEVVIEEPEVDILEKIKKAKGKDEEVVRVVEKMKKVEIKAVREEEWQLEGDLVLKEGKVYVPKDEELRMEIIQLHHDVLVARYGGKWKTTELVIRNYWWLEITKDIGKYVEGYDMCQRIKNRTETPAEKLKLSKVLEKLWTHIMVDFITKLLVVAGKDAILVVCNRLSKMTHFVATIKRMSAEGLARLFKNNTQKLHRLPESIVLDRRPQFATEMTKQLNRMLGIETRLSTLYHPQTDKQMERMNQELEQYLRFFIDHRQKDWPEWLVLVEFAVNNKAYSTTKIFLFMANYGREMRIGVDLRKKEKVEKVTEFAERMRKVQEEAEAASMKVQKEMKRQADRGRREAENWKVGDKIILSMKDLVFKERPVKKLVDQFIGPYTINKVISTNAIKLQLPMLIRIHPVVNIS